MLVYRISNSKYASDLSGRGAFLYGGRWNSEGVSALYTSENRSLALLELMVHTPAKLLALGDYTILTIRLSSENPLVEAPDPNLIGRDASRQWGDAFLTGSTKLAFKSPSIIMPKENNIIINPRHKSQNSINLMNLEVLKFDERLSLLST